MIGRFRASLVAMSVCGALVLSGCGGTADSSQTVKALWYGKQSDGSIAQGITPVVVETDQNGTSGDVNIDLSGMADASTGAYWNAAAYSAAAVATIGAAVDPRNVEIAFGVKEEIDGPSAGGLMTVGVSSDLAGVKIANDKSMTGTILPDGSLGPVGGIPAKIRAAAKAGIKTVVIPAGQRQSKDPETNMTVDVINQGKDLGVDVTEAASVTQAYDILVGPASQVPMSTPGPLDPDLVTLLTKRSQAAINTLEQTKVAKGNEPAPYSRLSASVDQALARAKKALDAGEVVQSYAAASEALQVVLGWNAAVTTTSAATKNMAPVVSAQREAAQAVEQTARAQLTSAAATSLTYVEQVPALVDAMSWGVDAVLRMNQALGALQLATTPSEVAAVASSIARANYDATEYLSTAVDAVTATGKEKLNDQAGAWAFIDGYAGLLGKAAEANLAYAAQASKTQKGVQEDAAYSDIALQEWAKVKESRGSSADQAIRTATALSAFIATARQVAGLGAIATLATTNPTTSSISITVKEAFARQVGVATELGERQARILAGANLDTSYSVWGNTWGSFIAAQPDGALIADEVRRDGLSYQWFSIVQAKMLTALQSSNSD